MEYTTLYEGYGINVNFYPSQTTARKTIKTPLLIIDDVSQAGMMNTAAYRDNENARIETLQNDGFNVYRLKIYFPYDNDELDVIINKIVNYIKREYGKDRINIMSTAPCNTTFAVRYAFNHPDYVKNIIISEQKALVSESCAKNIVGNYRDDYISVYDSAFNNMMKRINVAHNTGKLYHSLKYQGTTLDDQTGAIEGNGGVSMPILVVCPECDYITTDFDDVNTVVASADKQMAFYDNIYDATDEIIEWMRARS